jgi:hypothetical protein
MSDLQCPATFLVLAPGSEERVSSTRRLGDARIAAVYAGSTADATAARVADQVGLTVIRREEPQGAAYPSGLADLADLHRGETVVVVLPAPTVAALARETGLLRPGGAGLEVLMDADGWLVRPLDQ